MNWLPHISPRFFRILQRNGQVLRRTWQVNFLPPILEPVLYLLAFGAGLGLLVGDVSYRGEAVSYVAYIAPALIAINIMYNGFFENTYASFVRMYYQKTYDAIMATPLNLDEIVTGEIVWGAVKSLIATILMVAVISFFRLLVYPQALLIVPLAFLGGLAFGSLAMCFTAVVPQIEVFNFPIFLFITPMFLFSGTFFPLETLPHWAQTLAQVLPLTHLVAIVRALAMGKLQAQLLLSLLYLIIFSALTFVLAILLMRRRLIN
ncbi:MAG: ABC transporter permease [Deltaproteobacteria bacterium]|nr:ABC transporter permease [Deltaproteobacteria bacterium]